MSSDTLRVDHFGRDVGTITRTNSGALRFEYAGSWLNAEGSFALATSLPLEPGNVETAYFRNLLPEAGARQRIAKVAGISLENDFEFLRVFGADCAGSLEITDPDDVATPNEGEGLLPLQEDDGARLATKTGFTDLFRPGGRVRLSLPGAQNKLAVVRTDEGLAVPLDGRPSTHILKLPNPDFKGLVENEALVLTIATALGLPVVEHEVVTLGDTNLLLIKRYDREVRHGEVTRLHQQDLCQATGLPPDIKYESEGGPSLKTAFDVVRAEVSDPLADTVALLDWVAFNVLIHNADARMQKTSRSSALRTAGSSWRHFMTLFAPEAMAMAVGGQFDPGAIARKHWTQFAIDVDVGKALVLRTVERLAGRPPDVQDEQMAALRDRLGSFPRRQQVERAIKRRVKKATD